MMIGGSCCLVCELTNKSMTLCKMHRLSPGLAIQFWDELTQSHLHVEPIKSHSPCPKSKPHFDLEHDTPLRVQSQ